MKPIQLIYVENVISRKKKVPRQELTFFMRVKNVSYDKRVDVIWSGEDGVWHTLPVQYHSHWHDDVENWMVRTSFPLTANQALPGNIRFGLRYRVEGQEFWDNSHGHNYESQADSGIQLGPEILVHNVGFHNQLQEGQKTLPITVVLDKTVHAEKVTIHWTVDNWQHTFKTTCHCKKNYWDGKAKSNARNPNQYGAQVWSGRLRIGSAFRLQYSICCEAHGQILWDNNEGRNYVASRKPLTVMILNLHCYQETEQDQKFWQIAKAIDEQQVDIVCFQEVAEHWSGGHGDWESNSANIINQRLHAPYHIVADWSHLGFDKYREGVAILSRFPPLKQEGRYVSDSDDIYSIHSRKVVMAQVRIPYMGVVNFFSAHLSWWEDGFEQQFQRLCAWASSKQTKQVKGTLLCGDFNIAAGSEGYQLVVNSHEYEDQYLQANEQGLFEKVFRVNDPHWRDYLADDYRIDYIFMNKESSLQVTTARVVFTEQDYGRVSDHCGFIMTFEPK
ncbi:endonuclease/exonuclease/phosphatase family protein [Methylomarinum vadi]|uniref:endonuclease/exonuclease/phosphatase family protein n=1 Tax=Methylomarinum vadi TaxID=438855 RepID=UPI0004DFA760|nr:endonuclease/exonuclease/phosphatase family protein [Methylomarinum vadi]